MSASRFALAFAVAFAGGCIAFVGDATTGGACRFSGDQSTACGRCLASSCQASINACCKSGCGGALDELDRCGVAADCAALMRVHGGVDSEALASCARTRCATACAASASSDGGARTDGGGTSVACTADDVSCSCTMSSSIPGNDTACSPASLGATDAVCCATSGWPSAGGKCSCGAFRCGRNAYDGCACDVGHGTNAAGSIDPAVSGCSKGSPSYEWSCCVSEGKSCYCAHTSQSCPSGWNETFTKSCDAYDMACPVGQSRVTACTQ